MKGSDLSDLARENLAQGAKLLPPSIAALHEFFCGCGEPEKAWAWVLSYLTGMDGPADAWKPETGTDYLAVYLLDSLGWTEHGTSIRAAWLEAPGREALAFLEEHGPDWQDKGWWIDAEGCTRSFPGNSLERRP